MNDDDKQSLNNPDEYINLGDYYGECAMYDEAVDCYTKAIELNPTDTELYRKRARMYMFIHKNDNALLDCLKAVEIEPVAANYVYCAFSYYYMEEYERAIDNYSIAITLKPEEAAYYYSRGECYWRLNDCINAILDYTKAINLNPNSDSYYFSARAAAYEKINQYENAIKDITNAIKKCPQNTVYLAYRAWYHLNINKTDEALDDINKCIDELGGVCSDNFILRAKIYFARNDYDNALLNYTAAIDYAYSIMDTSIAKYYQMRGEFYNLIGNNELADADFQKAEEHNINL